MLDSALLAQLGQFLIKAGAPQGQLLDFYPDRRQLRFQFALLTGFVLHATAQLLTRVFLLRLLLAQHQQLLFQSGQRRFALIAFQTQPL